MWHKIPRRLSITHLIRQHTWQEDWRIQQKDRVALFAIDSDWLEFLGDSVVKHIHEQIVQLHVTLYILDVPPISALIDLTTMRSQVTGHNSMTDMTIHTVWWNELECHHSLRLLVMLHHSVCTTWNRAALLRSQGQTHQKGHSVVQHLCAMWPCQEVESVEVLEDRISDYFRILMKVWSLIIIVRRRWTIGGDGSWFIKPRGGQG